jgi:DNA-binding beta-propeller fold protein YncE
MVTFRTIQYFTLVALLIALSGCAGSSPTVRERYFWPPPPNQPRIEWLASYNSQLDLEKSTFRRFREAVVGQDEPVTPLKPVDLRADAVQNKVYVADLAGQTVMVFDLQQQELRKLSKAEQKIQPMALALDRANNLYILEPHRNHLLVFDPSERFERTINLEKICQRPIAVTVDKPRDRLYVADIDLHKVIAIDLNGRQLFSIGDPADSGGGLNRPTGLAVNSRGEVIVADAFNAKIQIFDQQGTFRRAFGKRGDKPGDFQLIKAVAVDSDDNIYVLDGRSHDVKVFNLNGDLLLTFGGYYAVSSSGKIAPGGFAGPIGIDIDSRDRIFVVDQFNARVQVFQYLSEKTAMPATPNTTQAK